MKFPLAFVAALALAPPAYAGTVTGIPTEIHAGSVAGQFLIYNSASEQSTWYGLNLDFIPNLAQFGVVSNAFETHTVVQLQPTGRNVPCDASVCSASSVPEVTNVVANWVALPIDGSTTFTGNVAWPITLFGGITPPTGFSVQGATATGGALYCWINDNGPAALGVGFFWQINGAGYTTPTGYHPLGPVTIWCEGNNYPALYSVTARAY